MDLSFLQTSVLHQSWQEGVKELPERSRRHVGRAHRACKGVVPMQRTHAAAAAGSGQGALAPGWQPALKQGKALWQAGINLKGAATVYVLGVSIPVTTLPR